MRRMLALLLVVAGCDAAPGEPAASSVATPALPTAATLPVRLGTDCACVLRDHCAIAGEMSGWPEVRNVNCRWSSEGLASCRWDERFVADYGDNRIEPGPWHRNDGDFQALSAGGFCAR